MTPTTLPTMSSLEAYTPSSSNVWDVPKIKHLYRRLGYGASQNTINTALTKSPSVIVDEIMNAAINDPLTPEPDWVYKTFSDYPSQIAFDEANQKISTIQNINLR